MRELVEKYIALREAKSKMDRKHKDKMAHLTEVMDAIEAELLSEFDRQGIDSVRTANGTAYKSKRTSATVRDWDLTLDYIRQHDLWNMLEKRVNKVAVEEFVNENEGLPPGVDWRSEITVNVRRG